MPVVKSPAVILNTFAYGDTSRILRLLTPEFGLRSVIAKGARGARSRFGGVLEPFTLGEAQFNLREGRDLLTLTSFALLRSRQGIGRDLASFTGASLLAEIALKVGTEEPDAALFTLVTNALDRLANPSDAPAETALASLWALIGVVGFQPEMQRCVRCGRLLMDEEPSRFDVDQGGVVCRSCRPSGRVLDARIRHQVTAMGAGEEIRLEPGDIRVHGALLEAFLPTHLSPDRGLRSLALFREQLR